MNESIWVDYQPIVSRNALLNFVITERGKGKTYGGIKFCIKRFLKTGEQFVYLRRYKTELKESVPKFFDSLIQNEEFKDHKLEVKGNSFYCDGKVCGYAIPLSTANILKSTSFARVMTILFDEFIIDKGCYHYLRNEVEQFLDIIETIARLRDVRVFLLGNAISITNPYFLYFNLSLPYNAEIKMFKQNLILVYYGKNQKYREIKKASRFGKLIENTQYGKYAIDNEFLRDTKTFIRKKTPNAKFFFTIIINGATYGIWTDSKEDLVFISNKYDKNCHIVFALTTDDHNDNTLFLQLKTSVFYQNLLFNYRMGRVRFENQKVKNGFMEWFTKHLTY